MKRVLAALFLAAACFASLPTSQAQAAVDAEGFLALGADPPSDDEAALTADPSEGVVVPCPEDCSDIDDILAVAAKADASTVQFKVTVGEKPADSTLAQGRYCWFVGFQVDGSETEVIAMTGFDYTNGAGQPAACDTNRGDEVGSGVWHASEAAIVITVPLADIGASPGSVLGDIYALSYIGESLAIDDAAPDAKTDRAAPDSFGTFTIPGGAAPQPEIETQVLDGLTVDIDQAFPDPTTETYRYLWTTDESLLTFHYGATVEAGTATIRVTDGEGEELLAQEYSTSSNGTLDASSAASGEWTIDLILDGFQGSLNLHIAPPTTPGPPSPDDGHDDEDDETPNDETTGDDGGTGNTTATDDKGSPGLPMLLVAFIVLALAAVGRRR